MTDDPAEYLIDTDREDDLVEEAADLVGTERLWSGQLLYTGVEVGLFEVLDATPMSADDVADELDLHPDSCYRVLRGLGYFGVLEEDDDRRFSLTAVGELFRADHPRSVRPLLLVVRSPEWTRPMLHLGDILREGGPTGFVREFEREFFDYIDRNPAFGEAFNDHMTSMSTQDTDVVLGALDSYDFSAVTHVCDVGGGHGHLLCTLLASHPHLDGTVLERPSVLVDEGSLLARELGVEERCTYVAGDMFEQVPAADLYLLKFILHDWDDEKCVRILTNLHEAAPHDGRLFVVEGVVPGPGTPHYTKRLDLAMLVHVGGRERTESEYSSLFERSGWTFEETWRPDDGPLSVLEARAA